MVDRPVIWRIYYTDGSTFDNLMGEAWEAPGRGIVCIIQKDQSPKMHNVSTQVLKERPWFWYHSGYGMWFASDLEGLLDQLVSDRDNLVCAVKHGKWLHPVDYREILDKAYDDPDFHYPNRKR